MPRPFHALTLAVALAVVAASTPSTTAQDAPSPSPAAERPAPTTLSNRAYNQEILRAKQQLLAKDTQGGIVTLSNAINARPDMPEGPLLRARLLLGINKLEPAFKDLDLVLKHNPDFPPAIQLKAAALAKTRQLDQALELVDDALTRKRDDAMLLAIRADVLAELGDEEQLLTTLARLIAVTETDEAKKTARLHAAKAYARVERYALADSAVSRVILKDKDPRHRLLRITIREKWDDPHGAIEDVNALLNDQPLMKQHPQIKTQLLTRRTALRKTADAKQGPVYFKARDFLISPDNAEKRDALAQAVVAVWEDADHPRQDDLIGRRVVHSLIKEPTLAELDQPQETTAEDFGKMLVDSSRKSYADLRRLDLKRNIFAQARYDRANERNDALRAEETRSTTPAEKLERKREIVKQYPFAGMYRDFGLDHLANQRYAEAQQAFALAAGVRAYEEYRQPSITHGTAFGRQGGTVGSYRRLHDTAARLANGQPNSIDKQVIKAFAAAADGDFLTAGLAYTEARRLDEIGREGSIYTDHEWLSQLYNPFRSRYHDDILDAYVDAALDAKQRGDTAELERFTDLLRKAGSFAHAPSRTFFAMLDLEQGDTEAAKRNLDSALRADPLYEWAHYLRGRTIEAAGDPRLALLHYSAAAQQGQPTGFLKGFSREAGLARDRLEKQFKDIKPFSLYADPVNVLMKEDFKRHAGVIYATGTKLIQFDGNNNSVRMIMIRAAYNNKDLRRLKFLVEFVGERSKTPVKPEQKEWAYRLLAAIYADVEKDDRRVVETCDKALSHVEHPRSYSLRGHAYFRLKEYDKAFADVDRSIALGNESWSAYSVRAQIHEIRGDYEPAYEDIKKAAALKELDQGKVGFGLNNLVLRISQKRLDAMFR